MVMSHARVHEVALVLGLVSRPTTTRPPDVLGAGHGGVSGRARPRRSWGNSPPQAGALGAAHLPARGESLAPRGALPVRARAR